jgi:hypothetical protein
LDALVISASCVGLAGQAAAQVSGYQLLQGQLASPSRLAEQAQPASPLSIAAVNAALNVNHSEVVSLNVAAKPGEPFDVQLHLDGQLVHVHLQPHSVRSNHYRVLAQVADGSYVEVEPGPVRTVRGSVSEMPGAIAAGSLMDDGLHLMIVESPADQAGGKWWIEPLAKRFPKGAIDADLHSIYRQADVIGGCGTCGMDDIVLDDVADDLEPDGNNGQGGIAGGEICITQMACDADVEYFEDYGGIPAVELQINNVTNTMNIQYETQVGISHAISTIIVRTEEEDPYSSTNHVALLNQFRNHWLQEQDGVVRDVAQLFTGKNLDGSVIGVAYTIGGICTDEAYCVSQSDFSGNFSCATDLSAHELGHLWDASHCSCSNSTMNPGITCTNTFLPSPETVNDIVAYRNQQTCIECGADPPSNDLCAAAALIGEGTTGFENIGAETDGPAHGLCTDGSLNPMIVNDVWFNIVAPCTGTMEASTCDLVGFDSRIAVYEGCDCVLNDSTLLGCDDDTAGCGSGSSQVTVPVVGGNCYTIRVGGDNPSAEGSGGLLVLCSGEPVTCVADLDSSGAVEAADLAALLAAWGTNPGGPPDFDGSNAVGPEDLAELLSNWGACP